MVLRTFVAAAAEGLTVAADSPFLTPGSSIINNSSSPNGTIYVFNGGFAERITLDDDNNVDVFDDDDRFNHIITDGGSLIPNGTTVESESIIVLQELDENNQPIGPSINVSVFSRDGQTSNVWGFSADARLTPGTRYVKVDGSNNGDSTYTDFLPCFVKGTRIRSDTHRVPVEFIRAGTHLWTQKNGLRRVAWAGSTRVDGTGQNAPVRFEKGVLGNTRPLKVSPSHRMLFWSSHVELHLSDAPVLIPARFFVGLPGVRREPKPQVTYYHFMFDRHEVIEANGTLSESFYPGETAVNSLEAETRQELLRLFPELQKFGPAPFPMAARELRKFEASIALGLRRAA